MQYAERNKRASRISQNLRGKGASKAMAYTGFEKKGRKKTPAICNNNANDYNKTDQKLNNKANKTNQK